MAIIAILVAVLIPSLRGSIRQARTTVCQSHLKEIYIALDIYRTDNRGWLPAQSETDAANDSSTWWSQLVETNPGLPGILICPEDPWATVLRNQVVTHDFGVDGPGSYGLNDFIISSENSFLANVERYTPKRPGDTILVGDLGPDALSKAQQDHGALYPPKRNLGRMALDDLYIPGIPSSRQEESWLTRRHQGYINFLTATGNIKRISTEGALTRPISSYYDTCAAGDCTVCLYLDLPHYSFAEGHAFWWTGPLPRP